MFQGRFTGLQEEKSRGIKSGNRVQLRSAAVSSRALEETVIGVSLALPNWSYKGLFTTPCKCQSGPGVARRVCVGFVWYIWDHDSVGPLNLFSMPIDSP